MWFDTITQACTTPTGEPVGAVAGGEGRNLSPALLSTQVSVLTSLLKRMVRDMTDLAQVCATNPTAPLDRASLCPRAPAPGS